MALFFFGRAPASCGDRFDFWASWLFLFHLGRCALRIIATEVARELTSVREGGDPEQKDVELIVRLSATVIAYLVG